MLLRTLLRNRSAFTAALFTTLALAGATAAGGCQGTGSAGREGSPLPSEFVLEDGVGKDDRASKAKIIRDIDLNSVIDGKFSDRTRVYGFTFEAKAGATIKVEVQAVAGSGSSDVAAGEPLDTLLGVYGPMSGDDRGALIAEADDDASGTQAQLAPLKITEDARYLVAMSTWDDPGKGTYKIKVTCEGTDFQCRRPVVQQPCNPETRYIQGGTVVGTETWNQCKVVLLETTKVAQGAVLTVNPGVNVQGNYLGTGQFGDVALEVEGTLQAVGTPEAPVVFSALRDGWKGLVLRGDSNTLEHVFIEKAEVGVTTHGQNSSFRDLNIHTGDTGLRFAAGSHGNKVQRVRIANVRDGVHLAGTAEIEDSVILSRNERGGSGIWGDGSQEGSAFRRALIAGFDHGLYLVSTQLEVYDATITNNKRGVFVTGENAGVHPSYECPVFPQAPPPPPVRPAAPASWGRDPVFIRCDIVKNEEYGIRIEAPELLVVEESNIHGNAGAGIVVAADSLHPESRIVRSNVFANGTDGVQVESFHVNGTLDISHNYWAQISDPELSASWRMRHEQAVTCTSDRRAHNGCQWNGNGYTCGAYTCDTNARNCSATVTAAWESPITFTGFSPTQLPAGPDLRHIAEQVMKEREAQGL